MCDLKKTAILSLILATFAIVMGISLGSIIEPSAREAAAEAPKSLAEVFVVAFQNDLLKIAVKTTVLILLMVPNLWFIRKSMGIQKYSELITQLKRRDHNDSSVILIIGSLLASCILINGMPFTRFISFLCFLSVKGGVAVYLGIALSVIVLRLIGFKKCESAEGDLQNAGSNATAYTIASGMVAAAILV